MDGSWIPFEFLSKKASRRATNKDKKDISARNFDRSGDAQRMGRDRRKKTTKKKLPAFVLHVT
jgi:hypothetical protein